MDRGWMRKENPPTLDDCIRCNSQFRTTDATGSPHSKPSIRVYDDTDGSWWAYTTNSDDLPTLVPNDSLTHWLLEDFPPLPG